jgi:hypothetical protein
MMRPVPPPRGPSAPPRWLGAALVAAAAFALHAACWGRYGVFRDELYFIACGERLAWGYVDQPPAIAVVARAAHGVFGLWVPGLRLLPWLAAAGAVALGGRLALRLGGGPFAGLLASAGVLASPVLAALGHYLTMNAFEPVLFLLLAGALVRAVQGDPRWLVAAGAIVGIGLLNKYTMGPYAATLALSLLLVPERRILWSRWALAGAALAVLLPLPNLAWQAAHGFPFLELVRNGLLYKNAPTTPAGFLLAQLRDMNPATAPLWLGGLGWLLAARAARPFRFLGIAFLLLVAIDLATHAKPYYLAPAFPPLLAAGGVAAERVLRARWLRVAAPAALAISFVPLAPLLLPLLPVEAFLAWQGALGLRPEPLERLEQGELPQLYADQHGWAELARAVAQVYASLPATERGRAFAFGRNYGEASAIELWGQALGLEVPPVASGHNSYWLWGPPPGRDVVLAVAGKREPCGDGTFRSRTLALRMPSSPWVMPYEDALSIWICRQPARPASELWPAVRHYE